MFLFTPIPAVGLFIPTPSIVNAPLLPAHFLELGFFINSNREFPSREFTFLLLAFLFVSNSRLHISIMVGKMSIKDTGSKTTLGILPGIFIIKGILVLSSQGEFLYK